MVNRLQCPEPGAIGGWTNKIEQLDFRAIIVYRLANYWQSFGDKPKIVLCNVTWASNL